MRASSSLLLPTAFSCIRGVGFVFCSVFEEITCCGGQKCLKDAVYSNDSAEAGNNFQPDKRYFVCPL